jgi:phosphatidylserine decarboxylase
MKCKDRQGNLVSQNKTQNQVLTFLYQTKIGRKLLSVLVKPWFSNLGGLVLNWPVSKLAIQPFIEKNHIDMSQYEKVRYDSYNDFFMRKIKPQARPIDRDRNHFIAPCDSKLTVYTINTDAVFTIKNTEYSLESLFHSQKIANAYQDGLLMIFRLTVDDYHRYCYVDNGKKTKNYKISGVFHTVNPLANDVYSIYKENTREFSILKSENFGNILMMEVGALLVGKIVNYHEEENVKRGEEKGRFEFGGSTIVICVKKDKIIMDEDIMKNSKMNIETVVKMGERIGKTYEG